MVDPYATQFGGLTAVINSERFVLEHGDSNTVLSLHPALTLQGHTQPQGFVEVTGFSASENSLEVDWKAVEGVRARTLLARAEDSETTPVFLLNVEFYSDSDAEVPLSDLHPLYIPSEGPGALAVGHRELLTLAVGDDDGWHMVRLDGGGLRSGGLAAFFPQGGNPAVVMALQNDTGDAASFKFEGARGKLLNLRCDIAGEELLLAEESQTVGPLAFGLGLEDPVAAADGLTRQAGWTDAGEWIPDFDPSETPGELPVLEVEEEPESEEWEDAELEASEEDVATDIESEASGKEPEKAADRGDLKYSRRSTAFYRWAQRQTRSGREHGRPAYHGWASGRRLEPVRGMSLRTRQLWRCAMPEPDPSELED